MLVDRLARPCPRPAVASAAAGVSCASLACAVATAQDASLLVPQQGTRTMQGGIDDMLDRISRHTCSCATADMLLTSTRRPSPAQPHRAGSAVVQMSIRFKAAKMAGREPQRQLLGKRLGRMCARWRWRDRTWPQITRQRSCLVRDVGCQRVGGDRLTQDELAGRNTARGRPRKGDKAQQSTNKADFESSGEQGGCPVVEECCNGKPQQAPRPLGCLPLL